MTRHDRTARLACEARVLVFNAALVQRVVDEIWNAGNLELADGLFAPTYVNHGGLIPDLVQGPEGIKFSVAFYRAAFPRLHVAIDHLGVDEGGVICCWTARGQTAADTTSGTLTGEPRSLVVDVQILESWTSWDAGLALERLGIVQSDQTAATA